MRSELGLLCHLLAMTLGTQLDRPVCHLAAMVGVLVSCLILRAPRLNFFLLSIIPAVGFWHIDSMELRKFPSIRSLLGFYYTQVLVLYAFILSYMKMDTPQALQKRNE